VVGPMPNTERSQDEERHRRTEEVNKQAKAAIADARLMVNKLNLALDVLDDTVTLKRGSPRAR
jgi:hypothetical protein